MFKDNKLIWFFILLLTGIEQSIKVIINMYFLDANFPILPPFLYFTPFYNRYYSWFNSMLQIGSSKYLHIIFVALITILILLFYRYLRINYGTGRYINALFAFLFSGTLCSLLDKVVWNGSLDYIRLNKFFIFDLKDIYIDVFIVLLLLSLVKKNLYAPFRNRNVLKEFLHFTFHQNK